MEQVGISSGILAKMGRNEEGANSMNLLDDYLKYEYPQDKESSKEALFFVNKFINRFPRENIMNISMDDFLFAPEGYGHDDSFCRLLMYSPLASMGNNRPSIFGIYLKGGIELKLSKTFAYFGNDYNSAFMEIKREIASLLNAADKLDYDEIEECKLNSSFKQILIALYHHDKFLPAPTHTALDAYSEAIRYVFPPEFSMAYRNHMLVEWMKTVPDCEEWDSFILMRFCDWLWRSGKQINGAELVQNKIMEKSKKLEDELDSYNFEGEVRDAIVKIRLNQSEFRERLLNRYEHCCLCGVSNPSLLIASHIKPWVKSDSKEKLDIDNGFIMCPNHDKLFDRGLISFNNEGEILISSDISVNDRIFMNISDTMKISLSERNKKYLEYHRKEVYKE